MANTSSHSDEFSRISSHETNVLKPKTGWGPSKRFTQKSQMHNPDTAGGINRPTKGSSGGKGRNYSGNVQ